MKEQAPLKDSEALRIIEFTIALGLLVLGVYMLSPWYVVLPGVTAFGFIANISTVVSKVIAVYYIIAGGGMAWGAWRNVRRYRLLFQWGVFAGLVVIVATRWIVVGIFPMVWIWQVAALIITGAIALTFHRGE